MIYESKYGTVDFWDPYPRLNEFKKIGINLSGGADSSLVTFMVCKELTERESNAQVNFITGVHNARPTNEWNAREESAPPDKLMPIFLNSFNLG